MYRAEAGETCAGVSELYQGWARVKVFCTETHLVLKGCSENKNKHHRFKTQSSQLAYI